MDRIEKALSRLTLKESEQVKALLARILFGDVHGLDVRKLKGMKNTYRVRKGKLRIIYAKTSEGIDLVAVDRRNEKTYK